MATSESPQRLWLLAAPFLNFRLLHPLAAQPFDVAALGEDINPCAPMKFEGFKEGRFLRLEYEISAGWRSAGFVFYM
ncbi:MAG TPA: hypothetical protein VEJ86_07370 [Candidatus Binataceae bacterium]|nr:hypothetical protein [Candidatus Binataceae bacterium]